MKNRASSRSDASGIGLRSPQARRLLKGPVPRRSSQAERSASTRAKIIDGAIRCLNKYGYSATTVAMVAKESGVSRGGMLHQFPTKVDLMLAVVAFASGSDEQSNASAVTAATTAHQKFMHLTDDVWQALTLPPAMAKLEIVIAARSDKMLAAKLPKLYAKIEKRRREYVWNFAKSLGIHDKNKIEAMVTLHVAAMRGLAIELMITEDKAVVERGLNLLKRYKEFLVSELLH